MCTGFVAIHMALLAGASAENGPVSVRLDGKANQQGFPVLHISDAARRGLGDHLRSFPGGNRSEHRQRPVWRSVNLVGNDGRGPPIELITP
jgi:hypothetical protein